MHKTTQMTRRGYAQEYKAKQELIRLYGKTNVIKTAVSQQSPDFLCFQKIDKNSWQLRAYEIKSRHTNTYQPNKHDKEQFQTFKNWSTTNQVPIVYWITTNKRKKPFQHYTLQEYEQAFM